MLEPGKLKKVFKEVEEENWMFRAFLKGQEPDEIDRLVNDMHRKLFKDIECVACSNCCKTIVPVLTEGDISRISGVLGVTASGFKDKYLKRKNEDWMIKTRSCPFLTDKGCSIYEYRPETCREYPYTHKDEITSRLINLVQNCEICPVVFEIFEKLKKIYRRDFEKYKKEMAVFWK